MSKMYVFMHWLAISIRPASRRSWIRSLTHKIVWDQLLPDPGLEVWYRILCEISFSQTLDQKFDTEVCVRSASPRSWIRSLTQKFVWDQLLPDSGSEVWYRSLCDISFSQIWDQKFDTESCMRSASPKTYMNILTRSLWCNDWFNVISFIM